MAAIRMIAAGMADQVEWPIARGNPGPSQPRPAATANTGESDAMAKKSPLEGGDKVAVSVRQMADVRGTSAISGAQRGDRSASMT